MTDYECPYNRCKNVHMRRKLTIIPQNGKLISKMTAEPYKSFLKNKLISVRTNPHPLIKRVIHRRAKVGNKYIACEPFKQ